MGDQLIPGEACEVQVGQTTDAAPGETKLRWFDYITVEPVMCLYMFAFMLTSVVEQAFFVHKACLVDLQLPTEVCSHLQEYPDNNTQVQIVVSSFHQYNNIASNAIPIVLALFLGAWSDRRGRKLPLLLGLAGKLFYSSMVVVNTLQDTWTLDMILWTATLPSTLTGADLAIFASVFSYMADVTTPENRTFRVTVLDIVYLATMPTGVQLGKYLFSTVTNESYTIMFSINAALLAAAILYTLLHLEWHTKPSQRSMRSDRANCCTDFFDRDHVVQSVRVIVRPRAGHRRMYLALLIIAMALYTFQRDEKPMSFLYTQLKFKWTTNDFSDYRTFQSSAYVIGTLMGLPLMSRLCGLRDTVIIMIGAVAHSAARVIFALAQEPWLFYLGGGIVSIGPVVAPVLRSMTSKVVPLAERGKVFAILACADNAMPMFSGIIYSQVYNATIFTAPNAIYWVTLASQVGVFLLVAIIHVSLGSNQLATDEDNKQNESTTVDGKIGSCENKRENGGTLVPCKETTQTTEESPRDLTL